MDIKGERREKKRESLKRKTSDNRKSVSLLVELIKKKAKGINKKANQ